MTAGMPHSNMANVPLGNTQVYEDVFTELIGMDDMEMDTGHGINRVPTCPCCCVHSHQTDFGEYGH